jgi:hypothetical protein
MYAANLIPKRCHTISVIITDDPGNYRKLDIDAKTPSEIISVLESKPRLNRTRILLFVDCPEALTERVLEQNGLWIIALDRNVEDYEYQMARNTLKSPGGTYQISTVSPKNLLA